MAASQFIALLESRGLLDPEIIVELYRQVEQSKNRLTPEAIARLLVDNGQLTRFQATKLVTELNESLGSAKPDPSAALRGGRPLEPEPVNDHDSVEDLLPDEVVEVSNSDELVEVIDEEVREVEVVVNPKPSRKKQKQVDFDNTPVRMVRQTNLKKKSAWESYRIIGYGFVVAFLIIPFVFLLVWFVGGTADEAFLLAESAYKAQDYERASKSFAEFAKKFPGDKRASESRVFSALAKVRLDADKVADPAVALRACLDVLPTITNEEALGRFRGDVSDTLLRIAEKFVLKIENTQSIPDRKGLIDKMDKQLELIQDPRYVGANERTQNELRIKTIEENRNRLIRDIKRGEDLSVTIAEMTKSVESSNVAETYNLRRNILRKYPQLESDTKISDLLNQATGQQRILVVPSTQMPTIRTDAEPASTQKIAVLVGRKADSTVVPGSTIYMRAKGSVYAMNAMSGQVLWRRHIGTDWTGEPKSISTNPDSDVLISIPEQGKIQRLAAADGALIWESKFAGRFLEPSIDRDDVFVAMTGGAAKTDTGKAGTGDVVCLDVITGQARWGKKLPQPIDVGVGGSAGKKIRYLLGNHSNLYAISRAGGTCEEVEYIGHTPSSIAVPPIWVQNQLILFENEGPDYCLMRVFQTNDEGLDIKPSQKPIRFRGHVVVAPQVDQRRIAVVTNLGEVAILEIDTSSLKDKVTKQVNSIENEMVPKLTWPLLLGNDLLLASTRLTLYQVQESTQKLNRQWLKDDGDQFTAKPISVDEFVIHSRVVRGNLGVRVTAIKVATGTMVWETDLGVPVTSLSTDGKGFLAITSQGSAFSLDGKSFLDEQPVAPVENLGKNQRSMMFGAPLKISDSRIAILNQADGNQLLLVDTARRATNPTKMLALDLGEAFPSSEPLAIGNGSVLVPLNNGQVAMIDPEKGRMIGSPFQPAVRAGERPKWLNPVVLADKQTVIIADQQRFIHKLSTGKQLRVITSQPLEKQLKGRLSVVKDVIVGVSAGPTGDQLDFYESSELKRVTTVPVEGRFTWGPYSIDSDSKSTLLAYSDIDGLVACDESGKRLWTQSLGKTVLIGTPTALESDCILSSTSGELIRIALTDGSIVARVSTGEPIAGPALVFSRVLLVPGDEGVVLTVPVPTASTEETGANR
jgi:outer membrane protein assembly factor BamB